MEEFPMAKKEIDWSNIGFGYIKTDYRYPTSKMVPGMRELLQLMI